MKLCYDEFMLDDETILPPEHDTDIDGAERFFNQFQKIYHPTLLRVEYYLEELVEKAGDYAEAYRPWQQALHHLCRGVYLTAKKIPLSNQQRFIDALQTFGFDSALQFLEDLCTCCRINLPRNWAAQFKAHLQQLSFAFSILLRQRQQQSYSR